MTSNHVHFLNIFPCFSANPLLFYILLSLCPFLCSIVLFSVSLSIYFSFIYSHLRALLLIQSSSLLFLCQSSSLLHALISVPFSLFNPPRLLPTSPRIMTPTWTIRCPCNSRSSPTKPQNKRYIGALFVVHEVGFSHARSSLQQGILRASLR